MAFRLGTTARNASVDAVAALLNGGSIQIRTGPQPTNVSDAAQGTLLATLPFSPTAFASSSGGTATANTITSDTSADNSGTAGHARFLNSSGVVVADADCGEGTGTVNFDETVIVAGGTVSATMSLTQPIS